LYFCLLLQKYFLAQLLRADFDIFGVGMTHTLRLMMSGQICIWMSTNDLLNMETNFAIIIHHVSFEDDVFNYVTFLDLLNTA